MTDPPAPQTDLDPEPNPALDIAFLFIGGQHQFLHGVPVAAALSRRPDMGVTAYVNNHADAVALADVLQALGAGTVAIIILALPDWLVRPLTKLDASGHFKTPRLLWWNRRLKRHDALMCLERTTTQLLRMPGKCPPIIHIPHGAGDRAKGFERRLSLFDHVIVAGEKDRARMIEEKLLRPDQVSVSGSVKLAGIRRLKGQPPRFFNNNRPIILYNPHFDQSLASWESMGRGLIARIAADGRYNLIVAPHVRLFEEADAAMRRSWTNLVHPDHVHIDLGSELSSDMSYTRAADIYIGDVSSQIYEFLSHPRPAIFLNAHHVAWQEDKNYRMWHFGEVIDSLDDLIPALERAPSLHPSYASVQVEAVRQALGAASLDGEARSADEIAADHIIATIRGKTAL